jgi:uridylate kinase
VITIEPKDSDDSPKPLDEAKIKAGEENPKAQRFEKITFNEILSRDLRIMDPAAIALARDNGIPVIVFSIREAGAVSKVLNGAGRFTLVTKD